MMLAPRHHTTAAEALRVIACWLALVLVLQGLAAAQWRGSGPLHRHRPDSPSVAATLLDRVPAVQLAHRHDGDQAERHHHAAADASVLAVADTQPDGLDPVAFALTAALSLLALGVAWAAGSSARDVWRPAVGWSASPGWLALPFRPPRLH